MASQLFDSYCRGMLQRAHPRRVPAAFVREALNVAFVGGVRRQRPALRPFQANVCASPIVGAGVFIRSDGRRDYLVASGTNIQIIPPFGDPVTFTLNNLPDDAQTRTTPTRCHFLHASGGANLTFIYDGVNTNLKYDGTKLTKMGLVAGPTPNAPTLAGVGGFISDGVRKYVMTLDSGYHEGNPTPFASARDVTFSGGTDTQSALFTSPTNGVGLDFDDPQVTTWKLWRTEDAGENYFFIDEATIGNVITDTLADDVLTAGQGLIEFVNAEPSGPFVALCEHRGQILGIGADDRSMVLHSNFDPEYEIPEGWPRNWKTPIAHADGDQGTALASFHEYAIVWKEFSCHALVGTWPDIAPQPIFVAGSPRRSVGTPSQDGIKQLENLITFPSGDGQYALRRSTAAAAGIEAVRLSDAIDDLWAGTDYTAWGASTYDRRRRTLVVYGRGKA